MTHSLLLQPKHCLTFLWFQCVFFISTGTFRCYNFVIFIISKYGQNLFFIPIVNIIIKDLLYYYNILKIQEYPLCLWCQSQSTDQRNIPFSHFYFYMQTTLAALVSSEPCCHINFSYVCYNNIKGFIGWPCKIFSNGYFYTT